MTENPQNADLSEPTSAQPRGVVVPDKPALEGLENKWSARWKDDKVYAFDRTQPHANVYTLDTPQPMVSGSLTVGSISPYPHLDLMSPHTLPPTTTRHNP